MTAQSTYNEEMTEGFEGMLDPKSHPQVLTMRNDEASAEIAFGRAVKYASATDANSAKLLTAITGEVVPGILIHSHAYDKDTDLGDTGVLPDRVLNILTQGRVLVVCENGCIPGDNLFIRAVAAGDPEFNGGLRSATDGTDTIDSQGQGRWETVAAAGALAWLRVDFLNPLT